MDQVARYQILEEIGRGAHGIVYKALDPAIARTVAIKAISFGEYTGAERDRMREQILREARSAGTLSHPNIVTVYDVLDSGDSAQIVMEFVDGRSLEEAMRRPDGLSRATFLAVLRQVAQALDYAHRKGIVHRDIKPANIVLTTQRSDQGQDVPVAKIADFGVAKLTSHDLTQQPLSGSQQAPIGTPNYMSPEQIQGRAVTGTSDEFSLALIAYEILCGRKAFSADDTDTLFYRICNRKQDAVDEVNAALSVTVTKVMDRALEKNPEARFQNCSEFAGALEFALGDSPEWGPGLVGIRKPWSDKSVVPFESPAEKDSSGWRTKVVWIAILGFAVGLAIVAIVKMNSGPSLSQQVLEVSNAPATPPPVDDLHYDRRASPQPLDLTPPKSAADNTQSASAPAKPAEAEKKSKAPSAPKLPRNTPESARYARAAGIAPNRAASGEVQFTTDPPGANVLVDGTTPCVAPCSLSLRPGRHTLTASLDGYGVARRIFNVPADSNLIIEMVKSLGVLIISSNPTGAPVSVDGRAWGQTPATLRLSPGTHTISVFDGTRWRQETVEISPDSVLTREFRF